MSRCSALPRRAGLSTAGVALAVALLAGCAQPVPDPSQTTPGSAPSGSETPVAPESPELVPDGSADDNLPLFAFVVDSVWAGEQRAQGRAYIDALVHAGFDKSAMQVTDDTTTVGSPAESIQFSVRWGDQCLIGQVGPATGDPVAVVVPGLADGGCLVGATRPIDW